MLLPSVTSFALVGALLLNNLCDSLVSGQALQDVVPEGFAVGAVLHGNDNTWNQGDYIEVADREFNAITSSVYMGSSGFNMDNFNAVVDWARTRGKRVHGHVLLYPAANEGYWEEHPNADTEQTVQDFLNLACNARKSEIWLWDVVNEAFGFPGWDEQTTGNWGMRSDIREYWDVGSGGGEYVELAFQWARDCDPDAILILSETGIEEINERSDNVYNYVSTKRSQGVPIDGIGFHMHVWGPDDGMEYDIDSVRVNFQRFADAGLRIFITEMDVMSAGSSNKNQLPTQAQLERQARIFRKFAELSVEMPAVECLLMWDFADFRSWMHPSPFQLGDYPIGTYFFPTPWWGGEVGGRMVEKPAYFALRDGLSSRPPDDPPEDPPSEWVRLTSKWQTDTSYLGRHGVADGDGGWDPGYDTGLFTLDSNSEGWGSLQWTFEDAGNGEYHIRNRWDGDTGYLTRDGIWNGSYWEPGRTVSVAQLDSAWSSQRWMLEKDGDSWRIISAWDPDTGFLTRGSIERPDGSGYDPGPTAALYGRRDWSSQKWLTPAVGPADDPPDDQPSDWARLTSKWQTDTSYLGRHGVADGNGGWDPGYDTGLFTLDSNSEGWGSLQWMFEDAGNGEYRIRNRWDGETGYLTRDGIWNGSYWEPGRTVSVMQLNPSWSSQRWMLEKDGDSWRIISAWDPDTGFLTRGSIERPDGSGYDPGPTAALYGRRDWSSQKWLLPEV